MALRLNIVTVSTRPGRVGPKLADWFSGVASADGRFEIVLSDLADFNLPVFDEPHHPRLGQYEKDHTRRWAETVDAADAFVFVTPEYNFFAPPSFVNAIAFLSKEWAYKPAGLVSYGGASGGLRAAQSEKQLLTSVNVMPIQQSVAVPMVMQFIGPDGTFQPSEAIASSAQVLLKELHRWAEALKPMRKQ